MANKVLAIVSPLGGVNRVVARQGQPISTCWDALNVLPYDAFGRGRVGQRFGISKAWGLPLGSTLVQGMIGVNSISYSTGPTLPFSFVPTPPSTFFLPSTSTNSTWTSDPIPYGSTVGGSTSTGGILGPTGSTGNPRRNKWGPGGAGGGGGFGGSGNSGDDMYLNWNVNVIMSGANDPDATALITFGSGTSTVGVTIDATYASGSRVISTRAMEGGTAITAAVIYSFAGATSTAPFNYTIFTQVIATSSGTTFKVLTTAAGSTVTLLDAGLATVLPNPFPVSVNVNNPNPRTATIAVG